MSNPFVQQRWMIGEDCNQPESLTMANQEQSDTAKRKMDENAQREHGKPGGTVGRDVPDESKERHTEIAVGAGHKHDKDHDAKK
jgi:hypothetical protein